VESRVERIVENGGQADPLAKELIFYILQFLELRH
jgi:hypothetical protein